MEPNLLCLCFLLVITRWGKALVTSKDHDWCKRVLCRSCVINKGISGGSERCDRSRWIRGKYHAKVNTFAVFIKRIPRNSFQNFSLRGRVRYEYLRYWLMIARSEFCIKFYLSWWLMTRWQCDQCPQCRDSSNFDDGCKDLQICIEFGKSGHDILKRYRKYYASSRSRENIPV